MRRRMYSSLRPGGGGEGGGEGREGPVCMEGGREEGGRGRVHYH